MTSELGLPITTLTSGALTEDIYYKVVKELAILSPRSLRSATLVSRDFYAFTTTLLFRTIEVGHLAVPKRDEAILQRLEDNRSLCLCVRELVLGERVGITIGGLSEPLGERLLPLLSHMTHLTDFWFSLSATSSFVSPLVQFITRKRPDVRLHANLCEYEDSDGGSLSWTISRASFGPSPNLVSMNVRTHYHRGQTDLLVHIKKLALSSASLRSLTIGVDFGGCFLGDFSTGDIAFEQGERVSSLRKLSIDGCPMDESWHSGIPWDALEEIYFSRFPAILHTQVDQMHNLRSAKLIGKVYWNTEEERLQIARPISDFLLRLPSVLEELDLEELTGDVPISTIARFGDSLKRLRLHVLEKYDRVGARHVLSAQQLDKIRVACPSLEELQIDINRNSEWPYDVLDAVAEFSQLRRLTLSLELGLETETFVKPYATHYSSVQLYKYIASHRRNSHPLDELTIELGGHRKLGTGYPCSWVLWEMDEQATYTVKPSERLEDAQAGLLDVWRKRGMLRGGVKLFYGPVGGNTEDDKEIVALHERHGEKNSRFELYGLDLSAL
ncbi:uncharacterized protein EI90DRAFT_3043897 [Cantharellus anzutake]|uniref:uncharacterized protein n=1 Tax=Cantharellus anzutake TaxID=1750568 RepID=UPI0019031D0F|nr:uncharacterized protein EI90DRAFT_3043897 [Cantharellus anzutake]KAF8336863.1 hypothetical protein EI90DRAFT_3043897 [Cantharellus anzutake]